MPWSSTKGRRGADMKLSNDSLILLCAMAAIGAQLDRAKVAGDMRRMAALMVENCPDLADAAGAGAVDVMATLYETISAGMAGDLPEALKRHGGPLN